MEVILRAPSCIKPSGRYCPRDEEGEEDYDLARIMFSKSSQNSTHDSALWMRQALTSRRGHGTEKASTYSVACCAQHPSMNYIERLCRGVSGSREWARAAVQQFSSSADGILELPADCFLLFFLLLSYSMVLFTHGRAFGFVWKVERELVSASFYPYIHEGLGDCGRGAQAADPSGRHGFRETGRHAGAPQIKKCWKPTRMGPILAYNLLSEIMVWWHVSR
jgi:hypothetical protein